MQLYRVGGWNCPLCSLTRCYAFSGTAPGKSGPCGAVNTVPLGYASTPLISAREEVWAMLDAFSEYHAENWTKEVGSSDDVHETW